MAEMIARMNADQAVLPTVGAYVQAAGEGAGRDDMDDGYLRAIRLKPRLVGASGVPLAVAVRLVEAGLAEVVSKV